LPAFGFTTGFFLLTTTGFTTFLIGGFLTTFLGTTTVFFFSLAAERASNEFSLTILRI